MDSVQKKTLIVKGMTCASCSARIEKVLAIQDGIQAVSVNLAAETMDIEWDNSTLSLEDIKKGVVRPVPIIPVDIAPATYFLNLRLFLSFLSLAPLVL